MLHVVEKALHIGGQIGIVRVASFSYQESLVTGHMFADIHSTCCRLTLEVEEKNVRIG